uniref:Uncharacterized protein n=1 Tax=Arundo donax TaxID=35708 RepID=A0A0A9FRF3_ARUDO
MLFFSFVGMFLFFSTSLLFSPVFHRISSGLLFP